MGFERRTCAPSVRDLTMWMLAAAVPLTGVTPAAAQTTQQQQSVVPPPAQVVRMAAEPVGPELRISIDEAVAMALESNLGLQAERLNPRIAGEQIAQARAAFVPVSFSSVGTNSSTSQPSDFTQGGDNIVASGLNGTVGVQQNLPWYGGNYQVSFNSSRNETDRLGAFFNPQLSSSFSFQATQPLLRDLMYDGSRQQIDSAIVSRQIADTQLRQRVVAVERQVKNAYWVLVGAIAGLDVSQQNLDLAQQQLKNNQTRVEVGTMAPIDIVEAEAEVARNEEQVIIAQANIRRAEDQLRTLIMNPSNPNMWTANLVPTTAPQLEARAVDVDGAVATALQNRTDLDVSRRQMELNELNIRLAKNQTLPGVNLTASYQMSAQGGTQFQYEGFPPVEVGQFRRSYGDVLSDVFGFAYPQWRVGVNFDYPIGKSQAEASLARARLQQQQNQTQIENQQVTIVAQVRDAARRVVTNFQRVQATRAARELAERRLEAEQKRFEVGLSTTFQLFQIQRDVAFQRNSELQAILEYNQSLVDFEAVQVAPLGGF